MRDICVRLVIDAAAHSKRRRYTFDMIEHGGNFTIDLSSRTAVGAIEDTNGQYSRIHMTRGLVDWHSHPRRCKSKNVCALGVPSPDDVRNVVLGHIYGNLAHMVYAKEGTYVIQVPPEILQRISCHYNDLERYLTLLTRVSNTLHRQYTRQRFPYRDYVRRWCDLMRANGLVIHFFRCNALPSFDVFIDEDEPALRSRPRRWYASIDVPDNIETDTRRVRIAKCKMSTRLDT